VEKQASMDQTPTREAVVRIEHASKSFEGHAAVEDFTLDVAEGEFVTLLGPSGCGKTTLLRMVAGLEFPDRGRIFIGGRDVTGTPAHKRPVNMVFQRVTLFPHLNVFENVAFGLRLRRVPKDEIERRVGRALELVRLPGFKRRDVQTLSGGEAQRVALARALINEPRVLLLDEPLSALDLQIRRQLQVELKEIHRELGSTFLYVTHDQEEAMSMSDRVVVMNAGRIVQIGTPIEVYRKPTSLFVASFVGTSNLWKGTVVEVSSNATVVDVDGRELHARRSPDVSPGETVWILVRPESLSLRPPSHSDIAGLPGRVADVTFIGSVVHYRVDVGDHTIVATRTPEDGRLLAEGEAVVASWNPIDALVLREEVR